MPTQPQTSQTPQSAPTPNVGGFITAARSKGIPDTQIYSYLQTKGYLKPAQPTQQAQKDPIPSVHIDGANTESYANQVGDSYNQASQAASQDATDVDNSSRSFGQRAESLLHLGSDAASEISSPIAPIMKPIAGAINAVGDKVSDIPSVQQFANSKGGDIAQHVAQDTADISNIVGTVAGAKGLADKVPDVVNGVKNIATDGATSVKSAVTTSPEEVAAKTQSKTQAAITSATKDWQEPATINKPGFTKPKAILAKSPETPKFLAEQGLNPSAHIEDGKYNTADTANALRGTAAKMSNETLRPSLQMADYTTPKTPVSDILKQAQKNIESDSEPTEGDKESISANAVKEAAALQKKYPNGMSLTDMHDSKITYAGKGGYSPIKDPAADIKASANRSLASAFQKTVEDKAPSSVPVKAFNTYLGKYFKAADYLDSLHGKTAPVTLGKAIARGAAKYGGALLGAKFGGGVVSEFAGYQIGKALEHAAENLTNPMRAHYLRNLEVTNPAAFSKVQQYLKTQSEGNTGTPRLPSPSFTPLGPDTKPTATPSVAPHAARGGYPLPRDPKTGQVMRVYTSNPDEK